MKAQAIGGAHEPGLLAIAHTRLEASIRALRIEGTVIVVLMGIGHIAHCYAMLVLYTSVTTQENAQIGSHKHLQALAVDMLGTGHGERNK
ncbi:MAG: hypothetical protein EOO63_01735 [Hymenobacter sp.]|nr:MAG: hypothetical protein EOO63_01735 [Hymenobacter sp.]